MSARDRLKLRHLHCLVAVAEHGSFVSAAERLSITQPAVSKQLAELEEIVGRRLVERTARGVHLTGAGRVLLRYAGTSLRTLQDGLDSAAHAGALDAPVVVVGALPNVAATVLPAALLRVSRELQRVRVQVRSGSNAHLIAQLRQGALDLVVGRLAEPSEMQGLAFEHLYTERLQFVVRPGHPWARRKRLPASVLRTCRLVLPDAGTRVREAADRFFLASGAGLPEDTIESIDVSFARSYTLQSDAVWCVPAGVVEGDLRDARLALLPFDTQVTEGPVGLTQRVDRIGSDALQLVVAEIRRSALERT